MLKVYSPYDNSVIQELSLNNALDVENALSKASNLQQQNPLGLPAHQRISILEKLAVLITDQQE